MTETLAIWLPTMLISLVAVGAFLYLAYQSRSQIDKLQNTIREKSEQLVENFLQRESRITLNRIQAPVIANDSDPARWLAHMRRCWLEAELTALNDSGQHPSDYNKLQKAAMPLLKIARRTHPGENPESTKKWSNADSQKYLQRTRDAISSQKQFIQEFKERTTALSNKAGRSGEEITAAGREPHNAAGFMASMEHVEINTAELLQTIEKLERELAAAQTKYDLVKNKLEALEAIRKTRQAASQVVERLTTSRQDDGNRREDDNNLLDDMESAYHNSINEMKRMSGINRRQRQLIMQMERELELLRRDSVEHHSASEVLDKLKLQLRDYENCTTILEMESETLREQIQSLRHAIAQDDSNDAATPANATPTRHDAEPGHNSSDHILRDLVESISSAVDLENAGSKLVAWLDQQEISSVLFIKGDRDQIWVSSEGRVDDHSKQLLKSMMPISGQPISEVREGVMFIYSACRILLYGKGEFHERGGHAQIRLRDTFAIADHIFRLLQDRIQLRQHHLQNQKIQQKIQSLLVQYNYIESEHTRTGEDFRKEIEQYLLTADISDVQRGCIDTMLDDFDSQLEILSRTGKLIANGLRVSIQDLAKIDTSNSV